MARMKLSVIIVNYNVAYFLEQCLYSVSRAIQGIDAEVFVVDNDSKDGSCAMVREKFPLVHLIENKINSGFSTANNQAIRIAKGEYILLLNPDTVVEEDTFRKVISFMDAHPDAGGLGVRMIDGKGNFLPESKRGLPTPMVSFYKIFGLSKFFPKSKIFGQYHLGFLDEHQTHSIDVLAGAFMLMRKEVLDKVGLLDETFFMYGEDIDLSYRIILGGYKNYYFPETTILHYKGESTKRGSINYVKIFYKAMIIFARKHFSKRYAGVFSWAINMAVYFRALLAIFSRLTNRLLRPFQKEVDPALVKKVIIVGNEEEAERAMDILSQANINVQLTDKISPATLISSNGSINLSGLLREKLNGKNVDELIFCLKDLRATDIIQCMQIFRDTDINFKIAPPASAALIGSNRMDTAGDLYVIHR